jgi:tryptophan-rich sensory protein
MKNTIAFISSLAITSLAGFIGSYFTFDAIPNWYATLEKPALNPPNWIFGPVWTTLYILMATAAFLIWKKGWEKKEVKIALSVFLIQLVLNTLWSILFFGLQNPAIAFVEIVFMWLAIVATIFLFSKISKPAAWLLIPYILWVSFASYLNFAIWMLNK